MTKNTKDVQTPGANPSEPSGSNPENPTPVTSAGNEPTVADLMAELAALKRKVEQQNRPAPTRKQADDSLPDSADIDQSKLKSPVLTRQGWLVPDDFGSPAVNKGK